jgi:hypothetical protein
VGVTLRERIASKLSGEWQSSGEWRWMRLHPVSLRAVQFRRMIEANPKGAQALDLDATVRASTTR